MHQPLYILKNMKNIYYIIIIFILFCNCQIYSQENQDSSTIERKLELIPSFHSIQIEANVFILLMEVGSNIDFDILQSKNNICIGTRISVEHYNYRDFGGSVHGSPFTNYNLFLRMTKTNSYLSADVFGGLSFYKSSAPDYFPNKYLPRIGFEFRYGHFIGVILRGSTSFEERTGFFGIGINIGYNHFL